VFPVDAFGENNWRLTGLLAGVTGDDGTDDCEAVALGVIGGAGFGVPHALVVGGGGVCSAPAAGRAFLTPDELSDLVAVEVVAEDNLVVA
jgi:hypothetical protein